LSAHYAESLQAEDGEMPTGDSLIPSDGGLRSMAYARLASTWRFRRIESTVVSSWLWRTGDLKSSLAGEETLSIGSKAFVGTELAASGMVDVEKSGAFRVGARWASFFPSNVGSLETPISLTSLRSEWVW